MDHASDIPAGYPPMLNLKHNSCTTAFTSCDRERYKVIHTAWSSQVILTLDDSVNVAVDCLPALYIELAFSWQT